MSNSNASATEVKQLRDEVQLLRDELAIMKRKYEDIIYNLDTDNFSGRFVKEQGDMRAAIEFNAEGIKTKVSNEEFSSQMEQTAEAIKTKVSQADAETMKQSILTQTADAIESKVSKSDVESLKESILQQTEDKIELAVKDLDVNANLSQYAKISQTAEAIKSVVSKSADLKNAVEWTGGLENLLEISESDTIYVIRERMNGISTGKILSETYYYYNTLSKKWEVLSGNNIYTVFTQTEDGFKLKGNVIIDGGTITWSKAPVQIQYSSDASSWHDKFVANSDLYMRTKTVNSAWSDPMRIVGEKGKDASVTFNQVNDALCGLFEKYNSGTPTEISDYCISSPIVEGGEFYGCKFYAGDGNGYTAMDEDSLCIYDKDGNEKAMLGGITKNGTFYPMLKLGVGDGDDSYTTASIIKFGNGLWIGDGSMTYSGYLGKYPGNQDAIYSLSALPCNGIFIDFSRTPPNNGGRIYVYDKGLAYKLI